MPKWTCAALNMPKTDLALLLLTCVFAYIRSTDLTVTAVAVLFEPPSL